MILRKLLVLAVCVVGGLLFVSGCGDPAGEPTNGTTTSAE